MTWGFCVGFMLGLVVRVVARLFAPTISVSTVNYVTIATVTSVFGRDEYVQWGDRYTPHPLTPSTIGDWRHVRTGAELSAHLSNRCDGLREVEIRLRPLREVEA